MAEGPVSVSVPADVRYVRVVRTVASRSAASTGFAYDRIEDLTLALDEAAAELLRLDGGSSLLAEVSRAENGLVVRLGIDSTEAPWPPPTWEGSLGATVLEAVTETLAFERSGGRSTIEMTVA